MGRSAPLPALLICACMVLPTTRAQFGGLIGKVIQAATNSEQAKQAKSNVTHSVSQGVSDSFRTANQQAVVQTSEYGLEIEMPQRAKVGERYMFPIKVTNFLVDPIELTVLFSVPNNTVLDTGKTYKGFKLGGADREDKGGFMGGSRQSDDGAYAAKLRLGTDEDKRKKTLEVYATTSEPGDIMWNVRIPRTKDITPGLLPKLITIEPVAPSHAAAAGAATEEDKASEHTTHADADAEEKDADSEEDDEEGKEVDKKSSGTHTTAGGESETSQGTNSSSSSSPSETPDSAASHMTAAASEDAAAAATAAAAAAESPSSSSTKDESSSSTSSAPKKSRSSSAHKKTKSSSRSSLKTAARGGSKKPSSSM